jgi:hypothetical protein
VLNQSPGTIATAWGHWSFVANQAAGSITTAYLYGATNPGGAGITNLFGFYMPQLTGATNITAIEYAHATNPFIVTGAGSVGVGTASPTSLFSVGSGSKFQINGNGDMIEINNVAYNWPSAHVSTLNAGYLESNTSGTLTWRNCVVVSGAITFNNTASGNTDTQTLTVSGAASGDVVSLGIPNGAMPAGMAWYNQTGAAQQPTGTFTVTVTH